MNKDKLNKILELHEVWLKDNSKGQKADLSNAYLSYANLSNANLRCANLRYANLSNADLSYADLRDANLRCTDLRKADLKYADLSYANLSNADLRKANLRYANLDFTSLPLSCFGLNWKIDRKIFIQILYHLCSMEVDDGVLTNWQEDNFDLANEIHRADIPRLEKRKDK